MVQLSTSESGRGLWICGADTKKVKTELQNLNAKWNAKRQCWILSKKKQQALLTLLWDSKIPYVVSFTAQVPSKMKQVEVRVETQEWEEEDQPGQPKKQKTSPKAGKEAKKEKKKEKKKSPKKPKSPRAAAGEEEEGKEEKSEKKKRKRKVIAEEEEEEKKEEKKKKPKKKSKEKEEEIKDFLVKVVKPALSRWLWKTTKSLTLGEWNAKRPAELRVEAEQILRRMAHDDRTRALNTLREGFGKRALPAEPGKKKREAVAVEVVKVGDTGNERTSIGGDRYYYGVRVKEVLDKGRVIVTERVSEEERERGGEQRWKWRRDHWAIQSFNDEKGKWEFDKREHTYIVFGPIEEDYVYMDPHF